MKGGNKTSKKKPVHTCESQVVTMYAHSRMDAGLHSTVSASRKYGCAVYLYITVQIVGYVLAG